MTPKQALTQHIRLLHIASPSARATLAQMVAWHDQDHASKHLAHGHRSPGDISDLTQVLISLSPPKNPSSNRRPDRNWSLHIAHMDKGTGWLLDLPGTRSGDPEGAIREADRLLGYQADWEPVGWGFRIMAKDE